MPHQKDALFFRLATSFAFLALTIYLGYVVERSGFGAFLSAYGLFFALYIWVLSRQSRYDSDWRWFMGLGIVLRVVLLFSIPNLSDDFYRFLWDGRLAAQGIHPFAHAPAYFLENQQHLPGITPELFQKLNSPDYHTVYPPVCQGVFWLAAKLFPTDVTGGVFVLKLFLFLCELGTLTMLTTLLKETTVNTEEGKCTPCVGNPTPNHLPNNRARAAGIAYALNPLILLEITGNGHFEGAMLCFLLAGIFALQRQKIYWAALFWALATASKLVPLLFLPIVLVQVGWRAGFRFLLLFGVCCILLFLPLLDVQILRNMAGSLNLYFQQFAFNASGYYLLKTAGKIIAPPTLDVGRTLGPILGAAVFAGVWGLAFVRTKNGNLTDKFVLAAALYLCLATTVHPWYIVLPFGLSLLSNWRFPLVWTAAAALSYSHYAGGGFQENYACIAVEYVLVAGVFVWELIRKP